MIEIDLPDGSIAEFPDGTGEDIILSSLRRDFPQWAPPPEERTFGGTMGDVGASFAGGANALLETGGSLYGLATGDMDNWARNQGESGRKYWEEKKSSALKADEAARRSAIDEADGQAAKFGTAFWETVKNPALLSSFVAEQIPMFTPIGLVGRAGAATSLAVGATKKTAAAVGTGAAVGAGAGLQGADVGSDAYDEILKLPEKLWEQNSEYQLLRAELGDQEAKNRVALDLAQRAGAEGGVASALTNLLPFARTFERATAGASTKLGGNFLARGIKGGAGELTQESLEEGLGRVSVNRAVGEVDPSRPWSEGVGEAAGMGAIGGGVMGTAAGLLSSPTPPAEITKPDPAILSAPTTDDAIAAFTASVDAATTPPAATGQPQTQMQQAFTDAGLMNSAASIAPITEQPVAPLPAGVNPLSVETQPSLAQPAVLPTPSTAGTTAPLIQGAADVQHAQPGQPNIGQPGTAPDVLPLADSSVGGGYAGDGNGTGVMGGGLATAGTGIDSQAASKDVPGGVQQAADVGQSTQQEADALAQQFVTVRTVYGDNVRVLQSDLDGDRNVLPMYQADGLRKRKGLHRENIDLTGDKQKAYNKEYPAGVVVGKGEKFYKNFVSAKRELDKSGLAGSHDVVAASAIQEGGVGFALKPKEVTAVVENVAEPAPPPDVADDNPNKAILSEFSNGKNISVGARGVQPAIFGAKFKAEAQAYYEGLKSAADPVAFSKQWAGKLKPTEVALVENTTPAKQEEYRQLDIYQINDGKPNLVARTKAFPNAQDAKVAWIQQNGIKKGIEIYVEETPGSTEQKQESQLTGQAELSASGDRQTGLSKTLNPLIVDLINRKLDVKNKAELEKGIDLLKSIAGHKHGVTGVVNPPRAPTADDVAVINRMALTYNYGGKSAVKAAKNDADIATAFRAARGHVKEFLANNETPAATEESTRRGAERTDEARRTHPEQRKSINEMSPSEKDEEIARLRKDAYLDPLTGLKNRRAYDESDKLPIQVSVDADSLKWINDNMAQESGDMMLQAIAEALQAITQDAYRVGGDEFVVQAKTEQEAHEIMDAVQDKLGTAILTITKKNGSVITVKGIGVSYGTGTDLAAANAAEKQSKLEREAQGLRAGRGEQPPGATIQDGDSARGQDQQDNIPTRKLVAASKPNYAALAGVKIKVPYNGLFRQVSAQAEMQRIDKKIADLEALSKCVGAQ